MKYVKISVQHPAIGKEAAWAHALAIALLLMGGVLVGDRMPSPAVGSAVFVVCILAAFCVGIHLAVRLSRNAARVDLSDPRREEEWIAVSETGFEFKEKVPGKDFRYDAGRLRWQDITWIRTNTFYMSEKEMEMSYRDAEMYFGDGTAPDGQTRVKKEGNRILKTDSMVLYRRMKLSPGSFHEKNEGEPTVQRIDMRGYPERAVEEIKRYAAGTVKLELR